MDAASFKKYGYQIIDWLAEYQENAGQYPVMSRAEPGSIYHQIPAGPPLESESMDQILDDFQNIIIPGITHWNHPRFFAYFPCNNSGPSILAELLSAGLGINAMLWLTSPAATELEERMMEWLRHLLGLPEEYKGTIQDTASSAVICALICARERLTAFGINRYGFQGAALPGPLRIYASAEAHSSVEKGVKIAGFGAENLVKIPSDPAYAMDPALLEQQIRQDRDRGMLPCAVVATVGTTSSTALDPLPEIIRLAREFNLWVHVDAALAGSAALLPEKRWLLEGAGQADSIVFNPHKWLFINFDCSAFFVRHPEILVKSLTILPEYLKTGHDDHVINYRDWGIPLGRRFRALKIWFVLRHYGVNKIQEMLRTHLALAQEFAGWVDESPDFERLAPVPVNTICFRYNPAKMAGPPYSGNELEDLNKAILDRINRDGTIFLTHTRLGTVYCLRMSIGQTNTHREHVRQAWESIRQAAANLSSSRRHRDE